MDAERRYAAALRKHVRERGLIQAEVAEASGINRTMLNAILRGRYLPGDVLAEDIARALGADEATRAAWAGYLREDRADEARERTERRRRIKEVTTSPASAPEVAPQGRPFPEPAGAGGMDPASGAAGDPGDRDRALGEVRDRLDRVEAAIEAIRRVVDSRVRRGPGKLKYRERAARRIVPWITARAWRVG